MADAARGAEGSATSPRRYPAPVDSEAPIFTVAHDPERPGTLVASGELDATTAPILREALDAAGSEGDGDLAIDLRDVSFIDSSGLQSITSARRDLQADDRDLRIVGASGAVRRIFEVTGLHGLLDAG